MYGSSVPRVGVNEVSMKTYRHLTPSLFRENWLRYNLQFSLCPVFESGPSLLSYFHFSLIKVVGLVDILIDGKWSVYTLVRIVSVCV